ncbi:MAG: lipid-A-disaccharide synthase [Bacteroidetes bacterium]|nr:lipid-A-disaccharide synthase [Bacteroidota bacterium]
MKYYIIAGEASGDLHGANLMKNLKLVDPDPVFRFWGGDRMEREGGTMVKHYRDSAYMGFSEVFLNLKTILKNIDFCRKDILRWKPDVVIPVDYPGFNLRVAKWVKERNIKVFYYISPQVWAWHTSRVNLIRKAVDRMFVILPFEKDFYAGYSMEVDYVGHPLLDVVSAYRELSNESFRDDFYIKHSLSKEPLIAILPGSRIQEIKKILPVMISACLNFKNYRFVVAGLSAVPQEIYMQIIRKTKIPVSFITDDTYRLLLESKAAMVTSGTATLETALFGIPEVVCYKGNFVSYYIARQLVRVKYISLVNLIMNKPIVKELIQRNLTSRNLHRELDRLISDTNYRDKMTREFSRLNDLMGGPGASYRAATLMYDYLRK